MCMSVRATTPMQQQRRRTTTKTMTTATTDTTTTTTTTGTTPTFTTTTGTKYSLPQEAQVTWCTFGGTVVARFALHLHPSTFGCALAPRRVLFIVVFHNPGKSGFFWFSLPWRGLKARAPGTVARFVLHLHWLCMMVFHHILGMSGFFWFSLPWRAENVKLAPTWF